MLCRWIGRVPESSCTLVPFVPKVFHLRKIVTSQFCLNQWVSYFATERILTYAVVSFRIQVLESSVTWCETDESWQQGKIKLSCIKCLLGSKHRGTLQVQGWRCGLTLTDCGSWEQNCPQALYACAQIEPLDDRSSGPWRNTNVSLLLVERHAPYIIKIQNYYLENKYVYQIVGVRNSDWFGDQIRSCREKKWGFLVVK